MKHLPASKFVEHVRDFFTPKVSDPIKKAHLLAEKLRHSKRKLRKESVRSKLRELREQRVQNILQEFGMDGSESCYLVDIVPPSEEEMLEMLAQADKKPVSKISE